MANPADLQTAEEPVAEESPAIDTSNLAETIREGLFKDAKNTVLTLVFGAILLYVGFRSYNFLFNNLKPTPDGELVNAWRIIRLNLEFFMVGTGFDDTGIGFPMLWAALYAAAAALGVATGRPRGVEPTPMKLRTRLGIAVPPALFGLVVLTYVETFLPILLTLLVPVVYVAVSRLVPLLPEAVVARRGLLVTALSLLAFLLETGFAPIENIDEFGGLLLTINVALASIVLCFPIGVVMALARRSSFPLIRPIAVAYIELIRGVPLITLLFMGRFALSFFLPPGTESPPEVIKAIVMFTLFSGAYVAEIVRGGLQSVPAGQTEAGQAVGLSPLTITFRIVLPQALRNSIPALVGQFIALLKDTTLLVIIGIFGVLGVSDPILANLEFANQGYASEVYAFVAFVFWVMCFAMSRASQRLETKLGVGTR